MAPDTTRKAEPLTWKEAYGDLMHNVHRCIIGQIDVVALTHHQGRIMDSLAANPPADESEAITSLQRELAEARAACQQAVDAMRDYPAYPEDADADKLASACKRCEMVLAPGPSDAKGKPEYQSNTNTDQIGMKPSLTPLTSPIVRGVLVDDGEPRPIQRGEACITDDGKLWVNPSPWASKDHQPIKLRPASEFGVPAEPAQKLVPLPEGVVVLVKREGRSPVVGEYINVNGNLCFVDKHWRGETSDEIWTPLDPALYGVDAERVRELEAEVARLTKDNAQWEESCGLASESAGACQSEAERLRKAIETHRRRTSDGWDINDFDRELWSALAPPTAASGAYKPLTENPLREQPPFEPTPMKPWVASSAPAAESEWGESVANLLSVIRDLRKRIGDDAARLSACEERCRELEAACRKAGGILEPAIRGHVVSNLAKAAFDTLQGVLAAKAEGGVDGD